MEERLQKILAKAGIASRRSAEQLIRDGRIRINGQVVMEMGCKADPSHDRITCDGKPIVFEEKSYVLLNKPAGYVTTLSDPQGRPVVSDLINGIPLRLFPVGRLDLDTEGALLMTNDGELGNAILHPRFEVKKTYEALVTGAPSLEKLRRLELGIEIDGGRTRPAIIRVLKQYKDQTLIEVIIHEGKKRQVRKMFQALNHRVLHLKRTAYGKLGLGTLPLGKFRVLAPDDLKKIFSGKIPFTIKNIPD
jgi:23S rRNA pseudouridine2605 synthase